MAEQRGVDINWTRSLGSALGAVSSAVLLSTLGVAGTLIGAALGSLVITVGGALYSHSLTKTKEVIKTTARANGTRANGTQANGARAHESRARASRDPQDGLDQATAEYTSVPLADEDDPPTDASWKQRLRELPWKRILGGTAGLFAVAMALILAFELTTGRAVSSYTGGSSKTETGTSIPGFSGRSGSGTDPEQNQQDPQQQDQQDPQQQDQQDPQQQEEAPQEEPEPQEEAPQEAPQEAPVPQQQAPQPQGNPEG